MPKEKPILCNTEMVRAILDERKTQTRQLIKPQPPERCTFFGWRSIDRKAGWGIGICVKHCSKIPWQPEDVLWVKETWGYYTEKLEDALYYEYKATLDPQWDDHNKVNPPRWRHPLHMPREAARLFLKITNIRVERVQVLTEEDALREGMTQQLRTKLGYKTEESKEAFNYFQARDTFKLYWDSLYAKPRPVREHGVIVRYESYPWKNIQETRTYKGLPWVVCGNPWVWVIEFRRVDAND